MRRWRRRLARASAQRGVSIYRPRGDRLRRARWGSAGGWMWGLRLARKRSWGWNNARRIDRMAVWYAAPGNAHGGETLSPSSALFTNSMRTNSQPVERLFMHSHGYALRAFGKLPWGQTLSPSSASTWGQSSARRNSHGG